MPAETLALRSDRRGSSDAHFFRILLAAALLAPAATAVGQAAAVQAEPALRAEAERFMAAYADELRAGDRAAIARRYDRRGAWRVGHGEAVLESWDRIQAIYASEQWRPPVAFEWRDLAYEPAGPDSIMVVGRFAWTPIQGRPPFVYSYTGLLVRQDGALRIRLEDESTGRN